MTEGTPPPIDIDCAAYEAPLPPERQDEMLSWIASQTEKHSHHRWSKLQEQSTHFRIGVATAITFAGCILALGLTGIRQDQTPLTAPAL